MKYYLDTEFLEGTQKKWFNRTTPNTIDLISNALADARWNKQLHEFINKL